MKAATVDMLRAHLIVASVTAAGGGLMALLALATTPVSQQTLSSLPFQLLALAVIICGVFVMRHVGSVAFDFAVKRRQVTSYMSTTRATFVVNNCQWRWLVILHLRLRGRPFLLAAE